MPRTVSMPAAEIQRTVPSTMVRLAPPAVTRTGVVGSSVRKADTLDLQVDYRSTIPG